MLFGQAHFGEARLDSRSNLGGVVHAQSGLGHHRQLLGLRGMHTGHVGHVFHQVDTAFQLPHGAFDFRVAFMANHQKFVTFFVQLGNFHMHLADQRAGGVKNLETARLRLVLHRFAHAVR